MDEAVESGPAPAQPVPPPVQIAGLISVDLSPRDNTYTDDYALLIDAGGNDTYRNNAGGNGSPDPPCEPARSAATLVDLSGDDAYVPHASCGVNGGAHLGFGLLVDAEGDDVYEAYDLGVNGGGHRGEGQLIDGNGSDRYVGGVWGANGGGGYEARGVLIDGGLGDDVYLAESHGSNGGAYAGTGVLLDGGGNDHYGPGHVNRLRVAVPSPEAAEALAPEGAEPTGRYIVGFHSLPAGLAKGGTYLGMPVVRVNDVLRFAVFEPPAPDALEQIPTDAVRYVAPDYRRRRLQYVPDDPRFAEQWAPGDVRAPEAWDDTLGEPTKVVCIADTGVRYTHEDLRGARWLGGYDFSEDDPDPWDENGHGTHVAGIVAATIDNGTGVAGMGNVGFVAARVIGDDHEDDSVLAMGIQWCADHADVINMSFGGEGLDPALQDAVEYAWAKGVLLVAAAGNQSCDDCVLYPAAYPEVVATSCTTIERERCSFSSYGPQVELAAPGKDILSTTWDADDSYGQKEGTSMAAPHVAGAAALIWSRVPDLTACNLRAMLRAGASDLGPAGRDVEFGFGLLDVRAALDRALAGERPTDCLDPAVPTNDHGSNGGTRFGSFGHLIDGGGNDTYLAGRRSTNGGADGGTALLYDAWGDDTYVASSRATNGGSLWGGQAALVDGGGDDSYAAGSLATNGGVWRNDGSGGSGLLYDAGGDDRYTAGSRGANGAAMTVPNSFFPFVLRAALVDAAGHDTYVDADGGTGTDCTVVPKGSGSLSLGAQIDVPNLRC